MFGCCLVGVVLVVLVVSLRAGVSVLVVIGSVAGFTMSGYCGFAYCCFGLF